MKAERIRKLTESFETAVKQVEEVECWSVRDLQELLGYTKWDNFIPVIDKAKIACSNSGQAVEDHFAGVGKMVDIGSGTKRPRQNFGTRVLVFLFVANARCL